MSYEITITQKREFVKMANPEWVQIGTKEVERDAHYRREEGEPNTRIESVYGYSPSVEKQVVEVRELLKQTVDELDLNAVIKAINRL